MARSHGSAVNALVVRERGIIRSITYEGEFFAADVKGDELVQILDRIAGEEDANVGERLVRPLQTLSVLLRPEVTVDVMVGFGVPFAAALKVAVFKDAVRDAIEHEEGVLTGGQPVSGVVVPQQRKELKPPKVPVSLKGGATVFG